MRTMEAKTLRYVRVKGKIDDKKAAQPMSRAAFTFRRQTRLSRERHLAVGIANSAPFSILSGQRCMIDFCFV